MSSKAKRTADGMQRPDYPVKEEAGVNVPVRISLNLHWYNPEADLSKDSFVTVQGVPKEVLGSGQEDLIKHTAEQTLINYINSRQFLEVYEPGKSAKDSFPEFYNISKVDVIQVKEVTIIK